MFLKIAVSGCIRHAAGMIQVHLILEHDVFGGVLYPEHVGEQGEPELLTLALAFPVFRKVFRRRTLLNFVHVHTALIYYWISNILSYRPKIRNGKMTGRQR